MAQRAPGRRSGALTAAPDRELEAGTSAHYTDPAYYSKTYARRIDDVRFYVGIAASAGGPVLEYGCGNGRITLPMARAGAAVTGVDLSAPMLADLKRALRREAPAVRTRISLRRGDMRTLALRRRFARVLCPFNAFLHLYERRDVERFLARAREHLAPGGELIFDVSMPQPEELARDPARKFGTPPFAYPDPASSGRGTRVRYGERFDYDKLRQILFVSMEFTPMDGGEPWMTPLAHRQFYPRELEALLHYNGWNVLAWHGDFEEGALGADSMTIVVRARPR